MEQLAEDIWTHDDVFTAFAGTQLRVRMTIVKLSSGRLWLHSPTPLSQDLQRQIDNIGLVQYLVAPNNLHNLWLLEWYKAYPQSSLMVSAGLEKKLTLPEGYAIVDEHFSNPWADDLDHQHMSGVPTFDESVFLHHKSQSLIVTDFIQNHTDPLPEPAIPRIVTRLMQQVGFKDRCIAPPLKLGFLIKDKARFAESIRCIRQWNFNRIIVTHGDIIKTNAVVTFDQLSERFLSENL